MLMAIAANQRIVGANRLARRSLLLDDRALLAGISLWALFEQDLDLFRRKDRSDIWTRLLVAGSNDSWPALVTPPDHTRSASSTPTNINLHTRPRLDSIGNLLKLAPAPRAHGGLSAGAMRRGTGNVGGDLWGSNDLTKLGAAAPPSMDHFSPAVKQNARVPPPPHLTPKRSRRTHANV